MGRSIEGMGNKGKKNKNKDIKKNTLNKQHPKH